MVNTFLIGSFQFTADTLDKKRVFKQLLECLQCINIIEAKQKDPNVKIGFMDHPVIKIWEKFLDPLKLYFNTILNVCIKKHKFNTTMEYYDIPDEDEIKMPWFLNFMPFIYSHRARLYQKDPNYYKDKFEFPKEYLNIGYIWLREGKKECLKAKTFEQISKLADPLNDRYKNCNYCSSIIKSGDRKGEECGILLQYGNNEFCGRHRDKSIPIAICEAVKKDGNECKNKAKHGNFCGVHKK